jgi:hypothetical protein
MNNEQKAELYNMFLAEYHRLDNQIGQVKMNKFELSVEDQKIVNELERKKSYIMSRIQGLGG